MPTLSPFGRAYHRRDEEAISGLSLLAEAGFNAGLTELISGSCVTSLRDTRQRHFAIVSRAANRSLTCRKLKGNICGKSEPT
jgi:hypothetical protein